MKTTLYIVALALVLALITAAAVIRRAESLHEQELDRGRQLEEKLRR